MAWKWSTTTVAWPRGEQPVGVAPERVEGDHVDAGEPVVVAVVEPVLHGPSAAAGHDIEQLRSAHVDEAGHVLGAMPRRGRQELRLVQAEGVDAVEAGGVVHQRGAVVAHRRHGGVPADPEGSGHLGH
jgi:hypothetical protein